MKHVTERLAVSPQLPSQLAIICLIAFYFIHYLNLDGKRKNSAYARSTLILAFSKKLWVKKVAQGFTVAHKCMLRVRRYRRPFDFTDAFDYQTDSSGNLGLDNERSRAKVGNAKQIPFGTRCLT